MQRIFEFLGSFVCHQKPERSFFIDGYFLPVCARCTGIYLSVFFSFVYLLVLKRLKGNKPPSVKDTIILTSFLIPISIDGFFSYAGFWTSNNFLRIITGSLVGGSLISFFIIGANFKIDKENNNPIFKTIKEPLFLILFSLIFGILILKGIGNYYIISLMISLGIISAFYLLINLLWKNLK